jgi:exo-1,4-beta-D-glucosaminidase
MNGSTVAQISDTFDVKPNERRTISLEALIRNPDIWWPARWGGQPLYTVQADTIIHEYRDLVSDRSRGQKFGIRHVSSHLNGYIDTAFTVNGEPFRVIGAGYGPDIFMRFDENRVEQILTYLLDMGMDTLRLEGKQEHSELYELTDRMGIMVLAGWECCDKWEGWEVSVRYLVSRSNPLTTRA